MKDRTRKNLVVGLFVTLAVIIFMTAIYLVGKKENIFGSNVEVAAIFHDVKGLREGDKVRLSGIDIGTVSSLWFMEDNRVIVQMNLEENAVQYIRRDSKATIANEGLMGSKVVIILPGSLDTVQVHAMDTLQTVEQTDIDEIMKEVKKSSENITEVTGELITITQKINRGDGMFGKIFTDTTFTRNLDQTSRNISEISGNLNELSEKVSRGQGIMGKLFADTLLTGQIDSASQSLNQVATNLMEITDKVNQGEGVFGRLFTDTALTRTLYRSSRNMEEITQNLQDFTATLNNDSSALHLFLSDDAFADSLQHLLNRLEVGIDEATNAAESIQNSGLIRMFSKDPDKEKKKQEEE
jgi:phospholipid/cholesterol/gamma-HCH transport system substrate-binding protein